MKKKLKFTRNSDGQSLVELALLLPFLMLLILGMVEFGWLLNGKITLTSAAREGARVAVLYDNRTAAEDKVEAAVTNAIRGSSLNNPEIISIDYNSESVIVTVKARINPIVGFFLGTDPIDLKEVKAEMRRE